MRRTMKLNQKGFTLIELITTVAIGAIILTMGVPAFFDTIKNSRLTTETNKLVADINLARSEAIKRGVNIIVCNSADPGAASPSCANSGPWTTGWMVFADVDGDSSYSAGDVLIRVGLAPDGSVTFNSTDNSVTYTSAGLLTSTSTIAIAICDDRGGSIGRQIQIKPTGRPRLITGDAGNPVSCNSPSAV